MAPEIPWKSLAEVFPKLLKWAAKHGIFAIFILAVPIGFIVWGVLTKVLPGHPTASWIGAVIGAAATIALCVFVSRRKEYPPQGAVKGLASFGLDEGALFAQLGRSQEIADLQQLSRPDTDARIIVVKGEPGAGITSLLCAGLQHVWGKKGWVYWRATPQSTPAEFAQEVRGRLKINLGDDLSRLPPDSNGIIIIDQFEQIGRSYQTFFTFLQKLAQQPSTCKLKGVLGVTYHDDLETAFQSLQPRYLTLEPFRLAEARRIMTKLLKNSEVRVDAAAVEWYLAQVTTAERTVWPKDIGIGIFGLKEWTAGTQKLGLRDFLHQGGATGILAAHLQRALTAMAIPSAGQSAFLQALHKVLVNEPSGELLLATPKELADRAKIDEPLAREYLTGLARWRILERIGPPGKPERYRLATDRLVPIFRYYAQERKGEAERIIWRFGDYDHLWHARKRRYRHLLGVRFLIRVLKHKGIIREVYGGKKYREYMGKMMRGQLLLWSSVVVGAAALSLIAHKAYRVYVSHEQPSRLETWKFPKDFYSSQEKLEQLDINRPMTDLQWLRATHLQELTIRSDKLTSLEGIANAPHLHTVTLELQNTAVTTLRPLAELHELETLTLFLEKSSITQLDELKDLPRLAHLILYLPSEHAFDLSKLTNLTDLSIHHADIQIKDRTDNEIQATLRIPALTQLRRLTLDLPARKLKALPDWPALPNLEDLTLELHGTEVDNLPPLDPIAGLRRLTLKAEPFEGRSTHLKVLPDLSILNQLEQLHVTLTNTQVSTIPISRLMPALNTLDLTLTNSPVANLPTWEKFPHLEHLILSADTCPIDTLPDISTLSKLTELNLNVNNSGIRQIPGLAGLFNHLTDLHVTMNKGEVQNITDIAILGQLRTLTLAMDWRQLSMLPDLSRHPNLGTFDLSLFSTKPPPT
ncbi:MAG TPA: hypothetical protein VHA33_13275, partial [Candidatus Angelobacter sp.]|nr:hypothetical protein [Candidatus Angelobacter sp.]